MKIKELLPGTHEAPLDLTVESVSKLHEHILRVSVKDFTGRINIIFEGLHIVQAFDNIKVNTRVLLRNYIVQDDSSGISRYFPTFIDPSSITLHSSSLPYFLHIFHPIPSLSIQLQYHSQSLTLTSLSPEDLLTFDIGKLYRARPVEEVAPSPQKLIGPNNERYCSLQFIKDSIGEGITINASCYAVIIDATGSYQSSNVQDYQMILKVTDPSIYPYHATIMIFHKKPSHVPKISHLGDIIRFQHFTFKEHNGILTATASANSKMPKMFIFSLEDVNQLAPYGTYKGKFSQDAEHYHALSSLRGWAKPVLAKNLPQSLNKTVSLSQSAGREETDVIARVYEVHKMGVAEKSPYIIFVFDQNVIAQVVVEAHRKKLVKYVSPGDIVRFRSVHFENSRLFLTFYSDILKIPDCIIKFHLPTFTNRAVDLDNAASLYRPVPNPPLATRVNLDMKHTPYYSYKQAQQTTPNQLFKYRGNCIGLFPNNPAQISGFYCPSCNRNTSTEICSCGTETEVSCDLTLFVWDGTEDDQMNELVLAIKVPEARCMEFINGYSWEHLRRWLINPEAVVELALLRQESEFEVIHTSIVK